MVDFNKTLQLIQGGLLKPQATWAGFLAENPDLKTTFTVLAGPLILVNVILGVLFMRLVGGYYGYALGGNLIIDMIMGLVMALAGIAAATYIVSTLAGVFQGNADLNRGFAAVSLAAIPAWLGGIVGALVPVIGWLVALAAGILSLVYLYRILPLALTIPADKRVQHYVLSLVLILVVHMILAGLLGFSARS